MSSKDFRPSKIVTLAAGEPWSLQGVQAIRNSVEMSYQLSRTSHTETAIAEQVDFTPSLAPTADETVLVYADGSLVDSGDYSVADGVVTFDTAPGAGVVVRIDYLSTLTAVVPAGLVTFFDTHKQNANSADVIIPVGETVCEVM